MRFSSQVFDVAEPEVPITALQPGLLETKRLAQVGQTRIVLVIQPCLDGLEHGAVGGKVFITELATF